jgi:hypothetical protein
MPSFDLVNDLERNDLSTSFSACCEVEHVGAHCTQSVIDRAS